VVRSELHRRGLRYRVDRAPIPGLRRRADIVFPRRRVAVFIDGCFWHGCPDHGTWPKANADWWRAKIEANRTRDRDTDQRLASAGWTVVRAWDHEDAILVADRIAETLKDRGPAQQSPGCSPEQSVAMIRAAGKRGQGELGVHAGGFVV
jgi:DNA mismatch endonuclease (patch repair protein)